MTKDRQVSLFALVSGAALAVLLSACTMTPDDECEPGVEDIGHIATAVPDCGSVGM